MSDSKLPRIFAMSSYWISSAHSSLEKNINKPSLRPMGAAPSGSQGNLQLIRKLRINSLALKRVYEVLNYRLLNNIAWGDSGSPMREKEQIVPKQLKGIGLDQPGSIFLQPQRTGYSQLSEGTKRGLGLTRQNWPNECTNFWFTQLGGNLKTF